MKSDLVADEVPGCTLCIDHLIRRREVDHLAVLVRHDLDRVVLDAFNGDLGQSYDEVGGEDLHRGIWDLVRLQQSEQL